MENELQAGKVRSKRESFSNSLMVLFVTIGAAVGLGNIWKFPYVVGSNGGAAFIIVYFLCMIVCGIPVLICETYLGKKTRKNAYGAFEKLKPGTPWKFIGILGIISMFFIMFFYTGVAGWVYSYFFKSLTGQLQNITPQSAVSIFEGVTTGYAEPVFWKAVIILVGTGILLAGVKNGIEKASQVLIPLLFILLTLSAVYSLTLPGSAAGIAFLLKPDFSKLNSGSILTAMGLAFFKLSVGGGTMITYGSYYTEETNIFSTSIKVAISDLLVSLLAGLAIFPAVFSFDMEPSSGPGLLFTSLPLVFDQLPMGYILLTVFFFLTAMAATVALLGQAEVPIIFFTEEMGMSRKRSVLLVMSIAFFVGLLASLSVGPQSILGDNALFGMGFFDFFDIASSNYFLPIGALLITIFAGYILDKQVLKKDMLAYVSEPAFEIFHFTLKFVTPLMLILVMLHGFGVLS